MEFEKVLTKVHKIEIMVVEADWQVPFSIESFECDPEYYNPSVMSVESTEVYWDDSHPLNNNKTKYKHFNNLFHPNSQENN